MVFKALNLNISTNVALAYNGQVYEPCGFTHRPNYEAIH